MDLTVENFFGVMSILISFVCVLLAGFLFTVRTERVLPNRMLAVFLLLTAIELSGWLWVDSGNYASWLNALRMAIGTLQMPLFLGFFISSCYSDFRLRRRDALHLLPFVVALILILPGSQIPFVPDTANFREHLTVAEDKVFQLIAHIQYYTYIIAVGVVLWTFRKRFRDQHAGARSEVFRWLTEFACVSLFAHTLILIRDLLRNTPAESLVLVFQMVGAVLALTITTWIALQSLFKPNLFRDVGRAFDRVSEKKAGLFQSDSLRRSELDRLLAYMETNAPYLKSDLSLAVLADGLAMTPREVSELLNTSVGTHFFDFVNSYRVGEAEKLLLSDPSMSVTEILYAVGFNSKSSFNIAFKKQTGMTPSSFRKQGKTC